MKVSGFGVSHHQFFKQIHSWDVFDPGKPSFSPNHEIPFFQKIGQRPGSKSR
jgi:hypothetical protein